MANCHAPCVMTIRKNSSRVRSKGHSNSKFLRALAHRKTHHAVKTHRRENECEATENREQTNDDAISGKTFIVQSSSCTRKIDRYIRIKLSDGLIQSWTERFRALACARSNEDRAKLSGRRCAEEWHVEAGIIGLLIERTLHQSLGNNAYYRSPRLRLAWVEDSDLMSQRALVAPMLPRKTCIHDRNRLLCVAVISRKIAPFQIFSPRVEK